MSSLTPEQWRRLSSYLEEALALTGDEQARWLEELRNRDPEFASQVQSFLKDQEDADSRGFMTAGPGLPLLADGEVGEEVNAYRLVSQIGQGGMGTVWLAQRSDGRFERNAAVKFLSLGLTGLNAAERFRREGGILGRLSHPNIAELLDAGVTSTGRPYLILEYVDGIPIHRYCEEQKLDIRARCRLFLDVLSAVAHAHANLIVHRDIKPSNVFVNREGQVKLLDFGIAKLLEGEGSDGSATLLTHEGGSALTPEFAAPEQIKGDAVTTATDIYALGVLLYLLLAGQHPAGPGPHSAAGLVKAIVETEPLRASEAVVRAQHGGGGASTEKVRQQLRGDLDTILAKALKKNPRERYTSVTAMMDDLRRYLTHEPISARPDTVAYRVSKFVQRNGVAVALSTFALCAMIAGAAGTLIQARTARKQRDFAFRQLTRAEAINDLDNFILTDAAPQGKPLRLNELLERAEHVVRREHDLTDVNHIQMLVSIGKKYQSQDQDANALRVLEEAYKLSRAVTDQSTRAQAACALGSAAAVSGDPKRAQALIEEGLHEVPNDPQYGIDRIFCLERGSRVGIETGDASAAVTRALTAEQILQGSPLRSDALEADTLTGLAEAYRSAGKFVEADTTFDRASKALAALGRDDTQEAGTLFNNWGLMLFHSGRILEAEKTLRRAINISQENDSEEGVSPQLLNNYAATLISLDRFSEAGSYADRAFADAQKAGDELLTLQTLLMKARVYRGQHDLAHSDAMLALVEPRMRKSLPPGHYAFASLVSEQSLNVTAKGDLTEGLRLANQAVSIVEASIKNGRAGAILLPTLLVRRSNAELAVHRTGDARSDAQRALSLLQASAVPGTFSVSAGQAYLALADTFAADSKTDEARAAARSAAEQLQNTVGSDHPDTRRAIQLVS